jgi:hypothetical protein
MLLEEWARFETDNGDEASRAAVEALMPRRVKRRRQIQTEDGLDAGWQEYYDYLFPTDNGMVSSFPLFLTLSSFISSLTRNLMLTILYINVNLTTS